MSDVVQETIYADIAPDTPSSWRLRAVRPFRSILNFAQRCPRVIRLCVAPAAAMFYEAATLGILRRSDIDQMVAVTYESKPKFYDPRAYRLPYEERMLPILQSLAPGKRMLDAFCGQGREAESFATAGFEITAIDRLPWMIKAGKIYATEKGFETTFIAADFAEFEASPRFDVVYTSCWMYSTCQGSNRRAAFLKKCQMLCNDDGIIVISTVDRPFKKAAGSCLRFLLTKIMALLTLGNLRSEFGERTYTGLFWHHFSESDVRREVSAAGLHVLEVTKGTGIDPTFFILSKRERRRDGVGGGSA
jgi:2-polyprenyl-3-methyl-5-hydroxy-6-metoxy-1,4-benzoquinol methylase